MSSIFSHCHIHLFDCLPVLLLKWKFCNAQFRIIQYHLQYQSFTIIVRLIQVQITFNVRIRALSPSHFGLYKTFKSFVDPFEFWNLPHVVSPSSDIWIRRHVERRNNVNPCKVENRTDISIQIPFFY